MRHGKIRVQIADDHDVVVQGLTAILQTQSDIEVVLPYIRTGIDMVKALRATQPRVLLLDYRMPGLDMLATLKHITTDLPQLRVIVITAEHLPVLVKLAAERGAAGYILKDEELNHFLPQAVREVAMGRTWFSRQASQYLVQRIGDQSGLSGYQFDVLKLMTEGLTVDQIADRMARSVVAIRGVQRQIREKLGVETNEQAIICTIRDGLVPFRQPANSSL